MCTSYGRNYKSIEIVSILSFFTMLQPTGTEKAGGPGKGDRPHRAKKQQSRSGRRCFLAGGAGQQKPRRHGGEGGYRHQAEAAHQRL